MEIIHHVSQQRIHMFPRLVHDQMFVLLHSMQIYLFLLHCRRKFKTQLCMHFESTGKCPFGDACDFAHGLEQLRSNNSNAQVSKATQHPLYKTAICRSILQGRDCPYGSRCMFLHPDDFGFEAKMNEETMRRGRKNNGNTRNSYARHNRAQYSLQPQSQPQSHHASGTSRRYYSRTPFLHSLGSEKSFDSSMSAGYRMPTKENNPNEEIVSTENNPIGDRSPSEPLNILPGYTNSLVMPTKEKNRQENQNVYSIIADGGVEPIEPGFPSGPLETLRPAPLPILEDINSERSETELWEQASPSALVAQYPMKDLFDRRANTGKTNYEVVPSGGRSFFLQQLRTT